MNSWRRVAAVLLAGTVVWASGCSDDDDNSMPLSSGGSSAGGTTSGGTTSGGTNTGGGAADASTAGTTGTGGTFQTTTDGAVACGAGACACDNGIDDDGDGNIDGLDAECTGPFDDDEGTFATGIPGDNIDFCQDCFFDGNSGHGDDGCQYHTDCLYGQEPPGGGSECFSCDVTDACVNFCAARTPNGCDCFGCCAIQNSAGDTVFIYLQNTCSLEQIDDETACPRCVQTPDCGNTCGRCELCLGKTEADLPADCATDAGTPYTCDNGQTCSDTIACPANYYCHLGCCLPTVF